ncbi:MAG: phosphoglucomutase/phosphomannomutase family protein [Candidatus Omnitrophica bacterium]|nr:phosphoglucomutase/phosphomannomutase family protein [Candidatus Omnitrophota bacterium]MCM8831859.1 phosphoglucomutase/phosphomannomutase family protein [Candidatus Omnitrophota bacterium]
MIKFGTDGWRAIIAQDFTFDNLKIVAQAIADYLHRYEKKKEKKVVIGYDARFLSSEFAKTVALVLSANRITSILSDRIIPTPVVSLHSLYKNYDLGIMITASHNSAEYNGLKIKTKDGGAADKNLTDKVEALLYKNKPKVISEEEAKDRGYLKITDLTELYVNFLRKFVEIEKIKKLKLKVLIDVMYGAGDNFIEKILGESLIKFEYLHNVHNPSFGGNRPEPIEENLKEMKSKMKEGKYDLGIVLDGDADRIATFDSKGNYINAQVLLPLLSQHIIKNRGRSGGIGKTVVGSNLIDDVALDLNTTCYETPVGFKYISSLFKQGLICIGGEEAGGIGFKGYIPERDGQAAALLLFEMISVENKSFDEIIHNLYKRYGKYFYSRTAIPIKNLKKSLDNLKLPKTLLGKKIKRINKLDGIKIVTEDSWLMLRQSGTEPIVRVYSEARNKKEADNLLKLGKNMIYSL